MLELVDNDIVISGDVLDAELVVFQGVRERSVPARETMTMRRDGLGRRATRELQKPPVLEDEAACLQSSVAAHERGAVDVQPAWKSTFKPPWTPSPRVVDVRTA